MNTPTPTPRPALKATGMRRRHARCPEAELATLTTERDQLRAENERLRRAYVRPDDIRAQLESAIARAERAEADLAALEQSFDDNCRGVAKIADDLAAERARLDWLESPAGMDWQWQAGITRATIDAKMQEDAK